MRGGHLLLACLCAGAAFAQGGTKPGLSDSARGPTPVLEAPVPPRLANWVNDDEKRPRSFDMQPPTIPHRIDGYQIDSKFNKCLDCHAREKTAFSQAVPVSPTHYFDRQGKQLPTISTRRYFCLQCHVAQEPVKAIVPNTFEPLARSKP
jgi:cytochrome c-type protein NapB